MMRGRYSLTEERKIEIEEKAEEVLKNNIYEGTVYVPVIQMAKDNGFSVCNVKISNDYDGFIVTNPSEAEKEKYRSDKFIGVNENREHSFKRFIVAHELGHYFMEDDDRKLKIRHRSFAKGKPEEEQEADYFASCLLMPKKSIKETFKLSYNEKFNDKLSVAQKLADLYKVPLECMIRRFDELGL